MSTRTPITSLELRQTIDEYYIEDYDEFNRTNRAIGGCAALIITSFGTLCCSYNCGGPALLSCFFASHELWDGGSKYDKIIHLGKKIMDGIRDGNPRQESLDNNLLQPNLLHQERTIGRTQLKILEGSLANEKTQAIAFIITNRPEFKVQSGLVEGQFFIAVEVDQPMPATVPGRYKYRTLVDLFKNALQSAKEHHIKTLSFKGYAPPTLFTSNNQSYPSLCDLLQGEFKDVFEEVHLVFGEGENISCE